jgi:ubiquinone/menaquinone biosynthesis C-methylase UbiE
MENQIFLEKIMSEKVFASDVDKHGSYIYATDIISSKMANHRISKSILGMDSFVGKKIIDIGCGDGTYSKELAQTGAALVVGIDPVEKAIESATEKYKNISNLRFEYADLYKMELPSQPYDIAVLRGVLHHLPDLEKGIEIACKLAKKILVMEPNGYNPVLKVIEKTSQYHIDHQEQSFRPDRLRRIFEKNNGKIIFDEFVGLVPMFCPNSFARFCKFFEKFVEQLPFVKHISCAQYMFAVQIKNSRNAAPKE